MESSGVRRVRCNARASPSWSNSEPGPMTTCSPLNWGSALVEELLETNVIANRSMAVLKELSLPGASADPALLSDLRHDKEIRSSMGSGMANPSNSDIMMEARRILKREEKAKKLSKIQNRIVDEEVDRFQSHIKRLQKMNQRLDRIGFPTVKKRLSKINHGHLLNPLCLSAGANFGKFPNDYVQYSEQDESNRKVQNTNRNAAVKANEKLAACSKGKSNLSVSGNKMDEHEIRQHKPLSISQTSVECQNTVFERIHQRYSESERSRVLQEGATHIRHSSPINAPGEEVQKVTNAASSKALSISKDEIEVRFGGWVDEKCVSHVEVIQKSEVQISEWNLPPKIIKEAPAPREPNEAGRGTSQTKILPLSISSRADQNKLENLSKMYAKWMTKVCISPNTRFEDFGSFKSKLEKSREGNTAKQSHNNAVSREEKIMQVLQALQKHKQRNTSSVEEVLQDYSRFSKSVNDVREEKTGQENKFRRAISGSCEHRLKAHKEVIHHQKIKLEEQKKEIENLKLSQLRIESEKSKMQTQRALDEVLDICSKKVQAQAKSLKSSLSLVDLSPGNDFVLRMEQRALEQKQRKLLAQERRKQMEEDRKVKIKELEEKKLLEEEELVKKKHEEAREMRRKERELREETRKERERMIALERKADHFCELRRLRKGLHGFKKLLAMRKRQENLSLEFHNKLLVKNAMKTWKREVDLILQAKMKCADYLFSSNLLHRCFRALKMAAQESDRCMQVAMDFNDFHLQERYFHFWLKFQQEQQEIEAEKIAKADHHFWNVLLRRYLFVWRKYPKVAQLEREKERRKMIWRHKVQQVLPDFRPILSSD